MLFIHQAPRGFTEQPRPGSVTPTRPMQGDRVSSRGRRTVGGGSNPVPKRPSSAAGNHATGGSETPNRRAHGSERAGSRPTSANLVGRFGLRRQSPPVSARSSGPVGPAAGLSASGSNSIGANGATVGTANTGVVAASSAPVEQRAPGVAGASMPAARPMTPMGRYPLGNVRNSTPGPVRVPSVGPTTLPLHVANIGPSPTQHQRPRSPTNGSAQKRALQSSSPSSSNRETKASDSASTAAPSSRPDSVNSASVGSSSNSGGTSSGNSQGGSNNLTTVISSALDYKRFLDRRKQMITQQVESAQQTPGQASDASRDIAPGVAGGANRDAATPGGDGQTDSGAGSHIAGGWFPGTTGPVKASHAVNPSMPSAVVEQSSAAPAVPGDAKAQAKQRRPVTPGAAASGSTTAGTSTGAMDSGGEVDETGDESGGFASARKTGSAAGATQHLLRRLQDRQIRAQTPTRYTQSSGGVTGGAEGSESGARPSRTSLPAGGARQACRSLGQSGEQRWVDRDHSAALDRGSEVPNAEGAFESGDGTGRHKHREPSVDGLLRECGNAEGRVGSGPLAGSTIEDYIMGKQIGQGAYATVFFALHRESGKKVAIKIYEKYKLLDPQRRKSVRCEIRLMERLRHPNIVIFHDALDTPKQIYIIMDFVGGGSLHHFLKKRPGRRLDDQLAKRLIFQVAQGIKYLHDRHIVHRDIKLENLLLDENSTVKIIDFGFSTIVPPGKRLKIFCGTPSYMAPEIVARKEYSGFCADIWALGVLLYALLCGSFPFRGQNDRDLYRKIVRGVFHVPDVVTDGARNLLSRVLTPDMTRRPSIDETLSDQWFSSHRDDLYASLAKGSAGCYQPNTSTSSTATTAAPSSSAGQSAREIGGDTPAASRAPSASRMSATSPAPGAGFERSATVGGASASTSGVAAGQATGAASTAGAARSVEASGTNCVVDAWGATTAGSEDGAAAGSFAVGGAGGASESTDMARTLKPEEASDRNDNRSSRQFEEEAISKLERLGYPRDEIVRQLKDESSHLCKLYYRFLKALTAWDSKK